jgi:hypothetical protein
LQEDKGEGNKRWSRREIAQKLEEFEARHSRSQRQRAEELETPRSTLQYWLSRKSHIDADPAVIAFLETPAGVAFLHRLVVAAQFVITLLGGGGIRLVGLFLELSGLAPFVAASYGAQQKVTVAMENAVVEFGEAERERLAKDMEAKQITVCEDETFHPETCLVAIEPVSNYILLEQYADDRQAKTWSRALEDATAGLRVEVIQATSDEGKGLLRHVEVELGAQHSPDVFHVQHEVVKGVGGALASKVRQAERAASAAREKVHGLQQTLEQGAEAWPELAKRLTEAQQKEQAAQQALGVVSAQRKRLQQAIQGISATYHPYDLETGAARSAEQVSASLEKHFVVIGVVAGEAQLSENAFKRIAKAKKVVAAMVATMTFFWLTLKARVEALELAAAVEQAVYAHLIPGLYLHLVSEKVENAERMRALQSKSGELLAPLRARDGPLGGLEPEEMATVEKVALACAQLFQRSSSCVEGRNGQLALHHHRLHRISGRKLAALTTVHNYFVKREDDTTAAERFFGAEPRNLFEWVLDHVDLPGRPAEKRAQPQRRVYLVTGAD